MAELIEEHLEKHQSDEESNGKGTSDDDFNPNGYDSNHALDRAMFFGSLMVNGQCQWNLTMKEIQVLFELYTGRGQHDISRNLKISINTVKTPARNIHQKLCAESHDELIRKIKSIVLKK
jgi:ATP/maltotriose-dependent transcriptional regulator MalT